MIRFLFSNNHHSKQYGQCVYLENAYRDKTVEVREPKYVFFSSLCQKCQNIYNITIFGVPAVL